MNYPPTNFDSMRKIAEVIVSTVARKDKDYGGSWRKRGGIGAFMVMARKWDRIEKLCSAKGYDIFTALTINDGDIRDDVEDLIGYLLLILETVPEPGGKEYAAAMSQQQANDVGSGIVSPMLKTASLQYMSAQRAMQNAAPLTATGQFYKDNGYQVEGYYGDGKVRIKSIKTRDEFVVQEGTLP